MKYLALVPYAMCVIGWNLYNIGLKSAGDKINPLMGMVAVNMTGFLGGLLVLGYLYFVQHDKIVITSQGMAWSAMAGLGVIIAETSVLYLFSQGGTLSTMIPLLGAVSTLITVAFGITLFGESMTLTKGVGVCMLLIGIYIVTKG